MPALHALPEAAKLLGGISVWTLRKHVFRRNVAVTRIGRRVFVPSEEIERIRQEGLPSLRDVANGKPKDEQDPMLREEAVGLTK
jgi:hypothetical protein